ncbi:MAG: FAD-binding protein [Sphingopyxis solisilvae]|uniref:FAD-binding protein n=1 Tax=Sphingopyxis solisilvae TaxID=1886788 RepID=UPI0040367114
MTDIELRVSSDWRNFHETVESRPAAHAVLHGGWELRSAASWFRDSGIAFEKLIQTALPEQRRINPFGAAFSFSDILGTDGIALDTAGLGAIFDVQTGDLHPQAKPPRSFALAAGGVRLRELMRWLSERDLSLETTGSYDNQSLAGSAATGVHGSALGKGGVQNHIRGLHLVTGPDRSIWLERKTAPCLADDFARQFARKVVRDDRLFEAALVNLGAMGIVNAVLIEPVPLFYLDVLAQRKAIDLEWLRDIARGNFTKIASHFGYDGEPYYYELILNPFVPLESFEAMHTFYFPSQSFPLAPRGEIGAAPALTGITRLLIAAMSPASPTNFGPLPQGWELPEDFDLPSAYAEEWFIPVPTSNDDGRQRSWPELVRSFVDRGGPVYSAALAIDRADLVRAFPAIMAAVAGSPKHFVTTLRFVTGAAGTIPFTRFTESVVIDFDGAGKGLSKHPPLAVAKARKALDAMKISYGLHWGKLGENDAALIEHNFGKRTDNSRPLGKWCAARAKLVPSVVGDLFASDALLRWRMN